MPSFKQMDATATLALGRGRQKAPTRWRVSRFGHWAASQAGGPDPTTTSTLTTREVRAG